MNHALENEDPFFTSLTITLVTNDRSFALAARTSTVLPHADAF